MNLTQHLDLQNGVIARRQALLCGLTDNDIERLLRRREWVRVFSGVYVNHTGPLTEAQREWAAVLTCRRAALAGQSALRRAGIATGSDHQRRAVAPDIEIVIPHETKIVSTRGVHATRRRDFASIVHPTRQPPSVRIEDAVLDVAQDATELNAVAIMSDACRSRRTTAARLQTSAKRRSRLRQRAFLLAVLNDAADGTHSLLEWRYRRDVEVAHALPHASRQHRARSRTGNTYRDVTYRPQSTVVELDGRLGHDLAVDRWADLDRDAESAEEGLVTLRFGYRQVLEPCRGAAIVARVLSARGWSDRPQTCSPACEIEDWGR